MKQFIYIGMAVALLGCGGSNNDSASETTQQSVESEYNNVQVVPEDHSGIGEDEGEYHEAEIASETYDSTVDYNDEYASDVQDEYYEEDVYHGVEGYADVTDEYVDEYADEYAYAEYDDYTEDQLIAELEAMGEDVEALLDETYADEALQAASWAKKGVSAAQKASKLKCLLASKKSKKRRNC